MGEISEAKHHLFLADLVVFTEAFFSPLKVKVASPFSLTAKSSSSAKKPSKLAKNPHYTLTREDEDGGKGK